MLRTNKLKLDPKIYIYQAKQMILLKSLNVCKNISSFESNSDRENFFQMPVTVYVLYTT